MPFPPLGTSLPMKQIPPLMIALYQYTIHLSSKCSTYEIKINTFAVISRYIVRISQEPYYKNFQINEAAAYCSVCSSLSSHLLASGLCPQQISHCFYRTLPELSQAEGVQFQCSKAEQIYLTATNLIAVIGDHFDSPRSAQAKHHKCARKGRRRLMPLLGR